MHILAGIDIHDRPERLLRLIVPWAKRLGARIDLAFASPYRPDDVRLTEASEALVAQVAGWRRVQAEERAELARVRDTLPEALRGEVTLIAGPAREVLPDVTRADVLMLVGTHGRTGIARAMAGSVAEGVVRRAAGDVLVLRLDAVPLRVPERPTVLAPVDWPVVDDGVAAVRRWLGDAVELHLVHAVPWVVGVPHEDRAAALPSDPATRDATVRAALTEVARDHGYADATVHVVRASDEVASAVIGVAERVVADVIALPTHGRRGLARFALGSVAERIVRLAECSVLVTRRGP